MKQRTPEQIISDEINSIITACKKIAQLSPQTVIPEEHCWNPKPATVDPVFKSKIINTHFHLCKALAALDDAYNITPLRDDHRLSVELASIRSEINNQCLYYKTMINGPY